MLCDQCQNILHYEVEYGAVLERAHHADSASFKAALEVCCFICMALASEIDDVAKKLDDSSITSSTKWVSWERLSKYTIAVSWNARSPNGDFGHNREIILVPSKHTDLDIHKDSVVDQISHPPFPEIGNEYSEESATHSPNAALNARRSLRVARRWVNDCLDRHPNCKAINTWMTDGRQYQPKRLVDIGNRPGKVWKLILSEDTDIGHDRYATLSHRWASSQQTLLFKSNIKEFQSGQSVSCLPQAFQDAIMVADSLGIRYIWIDCLCIMQDSATDWKTESLEMHKIYSQAVLNLSATGSQNNTFGFLQILDRPLLLPPQIHTFPYWETWQAIDPSFLWTEVTNTPLMRRGWVFQERFLAPRVLHFGKQQMVWECATMDACEIYPRGLSGLADPRHTGFKRLDAFLPTITRDGSDDSLARGIGSGAENASLDDDLLHFWCNTVESYTRGNLTKYEDKLVALAGVAEMMSRLHETIGAESSGYAAGIFTQHVLLMLEWHAHSPLATKFTTSGLRPPGYRAPSWSWASIEGQVYCEFLPRVFNPPMSLEPLPSTTWRNQLSEIRGLYKGWKSLVSGLRAKAMPIAKSSFGQVSGGSLCCHGRVVPVAKIMDSRLSSLLYKDPPLGPDQGTHDTFVLPLRCHERIYIEQRSWYITGLMIQPVEGRPSTYRRCGLFFVPRSKGTLVLDIETGADLSEIRYSDGTILSDIEII